MGLTERHLFENEDVPENYEWDLEDAVHNSRTNKKTEDSIEPKYTCEPYMIYGCGLDFNRPKYKEDCYFYEETKDMGATIRYCTQSKIKWGYCPCEGCDKYISNAEASKIIRNCVEKRTEERKNAEQSAKTNTKKSVCYGLGSDYCMSECENVCPYR